MKALDGPIRVAVVDDHPLLREGVVATLKAGKGMVVVAEGGCAADAVHIAKTDAPDVMLIDISMPGGGIEAVRAISAQSPSVRPIILTVSEREEDVVAAMEAGAFGYVLKGIKGSDLVATIESVARGETYITPQFAARLLSKMQRRNAPEAAPRRPDADLTAREEQILREVAAGLTNKEIAAKFELSEKTVKHYMTSVLQKLQARNRVEAVLAHLKIEKPNNNR